MPFYATNLDSTPIQWQSIPAFSNTYLTGTNIFQFDHPATNVPKVFFHLRRTIPGFPADMMLIPGDSFQMGNNLGGGGGDETPVHTVSVSAFFMDRDEVTNDKMVEVLQWAYDHGKLMVTSASVQNFQGNQQELLDLDSRHCRITWSGSLFGMKAVKGSGYPCVEVSWYGAAAYCNYRSEIEGRTPCYNLGDWSCNWSADGYRLPTEAEWEKTARGGLTGQRFPWGANINHDYANCRACGSCYPYDTSPYTALTYHPDYDDDGPPFTSPVGSFDANNYGLYDMAGNVLEWCWDWYGYGYYASFPIGSWPVDPRGPSSGSSRVGRGGRCDSTPDRCRVADRIGTAPDYSDGGIGFRTVLPTGQ
jgi:sulfatase modifying factor 1